MAQQHFQNITGCYRYKSCSQHSHTGYFTFTGILSTICATFWWRITSVQNCFKRVKTKAEADCKYVFKGIKIYYIPSDQINAYAFGWRSIGVTDGALNLDTRTVESLIAHEYGHIVNGDSVLNMVMTVNLKALA